MTEPTLLSCKRAPTDDRRREIAAAARDLIVEKGVEGLRTRDIAERVGINVATLHYHVPTKEALIELVAELAARGIHQPAPSPARARIFPRASAWISSSSTSANSPRNGPTSCWCSPN